MGGMGSGSWYRYSSKLTAESQIRIEVNFLKKQGYLRPGTRGTLSWSRCDNPSGSIGFFTKNDEIQLSYKQKSNGDEWVPIEQFVRFAYTDCNYGGQRVWLLCCGCNKRVGILYGASKYFLCRHCYNLGYQSQREDYYDRQITKSNNIKQKLGGEPGICNFMPHKPKGMHWKTYSRLYKEVMRGKIVLYKNQNNF
jgi:hypothetical protein